MFEKKNEFDMIKFFVDFRFIRIVGTHNTVNKVFHLVSMEVYYKEKIFALIGDIHG